MLVCEVLKLWSLNEKLFKALLRSVCRSIYQTNNFCIVFPRIKNCILIEPNIKLIVLVILKALKTKWAAWGLMFKCKCAHLHIWILFLISPTSVNSSSVYKYTGLIKNKNLFNMDFEKKIPLLKRIVKQKTMYYTQQTDW